LAELKLMTKNFKLFGLYKKGKVVKG